MMKTINILALIVIAVTLSSCSSFWPRKNNSLSLDQAELISRDFVTAISKLRGFSPRETTVQFHNPTTDFATELHDAMRGAGYGMQILPKEELGKNHVSYVSEQFETEDGTTVAYEVTVGRVKLGREYEIRLGRVFPIAALSVNGAQPSKIKTVDNSIFRETNNDGWAPVATTNPVVIIGDPESENRELDPEANIGSLRSGLEAPIRQKKNMATIGESNYSSVFKLYQPTQKEILIFPNDSLRMGKENKLKIESVAKQFDPATDVISVIGCSHGKTAIDNGNALLANGLASRVKEELIMAQISPEYIYEEGCWASSGIPNMPDRWVVLTLRSKIKRS